MPDDMDDAQELETIQRADALAAARRRPDGAGSGPVYWREGQAVCSDCDEPIGEARLRANPQARRCIRCQETAEREREV